MEDKKRYFENIYKKEADNIFRFILLRVSNREEAVDIAEEAFYKFWQMVIGGEKIEHPKALLFKISRNKIIDWYRKKKAESLEEVMSDENEDNKNMPEITDSVAHEKIIFSAETLWVMKNLNKLPSEYGEIIRMRFVHDLSLDEMANILSVSNNAVSLRLNRALQKLREQLGIDIKNKHE